MALLQGFAKGTQFLDNSGNPLSRGSLSVYESDTSTLATLTSNGSTAAPNPVTLDGSGRLTSALWAVVPVDVVVKDANGATVANPQDIVPQATISFDSISELKSSAVPPSDNSTAIVSGYYSPGDGGGGIYGWDSSSTATANNGTIIQRDVGGTGRWRFVGSRATVRTFGAKGDGSTDDTTAVTASINASNFVYFPDGTYLVTSLPEFSQGDTWEGESTRNTIIKLNTTGYCITQTTDAPQVLLERISILGATMAATFLRLNGGAMHYLTWRSVNFENLRCGFDMNSNIVYWMYADGVRVKDCLYGFRQPSGLEESTLRVSAQNNIGAVYELTYTGLSGGSFAVGNTCTGLTSSEATTIEGVIADTGTTGRLLVSHPKGTNGSPLTLGYSATETISNGAGVTATYASKLAARSCFLGDGGACTGITLLGMDCNVSGLEVHNSDINLIGGYMESYTSDIPVLKLVACTGFVSASPVPNSYTDIDDATYRAIIGRAPSSTSRSEATRNILNGNGINQFPDPTIQGARATQVWGGGATIAQASNVLSIAGADGTDGAGATFALPVGSAFITALLDIESITGTTRVQFVNTDSSTNTDIAQGERKVIRIEAAATAGAAPTLRIRGVSAAYDCDIRLINVGAAYGYIGAPETSSRPDALAKLTENAGAIGGTNDGNLPDLSGTPATSDLVAAIRELATRVNSLTR